MREFAPGRTFTGHNGAPHKPMEANELLSAKLDFEARDSSIDELESMLQLLTDV